MNIDKKKLRETAEAVTKRNASAKRGHPKYIANLTSAEEHTLSSGVITLLDDLAKMQPVYEAAVEWFKSPHVLNANHSAGDCDQCPAREAKQRLLLEIDKATKDVPAVAPATPVCSACNDEHIVPHAGTYVMCTRCPTPCQDCRRGGNGAYCATTPCACECHRRKK